MSLGLIALLLGAAALHAGWNAIVKSAPDQRTEVILVAIAAAVMAGLALPFIPLPAPVAWPYLAASVLFQFVYFQLLGLVYRHGELSYAYPLMRGTAPLITALVGVTAVGEQLSAGRWVGVLLLCAGVLLLGAERWRAWRLHWRVTAFGLLNAGVIAGYTIVDGIGIRASGTPWSYILWLFCLNGVPLLAQTCMEGRRTFVEHVAIRWRPTLLCGLCMLLSYGIALWAMTRAPLGVVAALRETSVLFATLFGAVFLRERFGRVRYVAVALVGAGAVVMKMG
jgi:drug/metabolite transporter (DMT)-like permease